MAPSALLHLGLLIILSGPALAAPTHAASIVARHEDLTTTDAQSKRFYRPIRPFPIDTFPLPPEVLPGKIIPSSIPLAPGPVMPDYPIVALPFNPTPHNPTNGEKPIERRSVPSNSYDSTKADPSRDHDPLPDRVDYVAATHLPTGDIFRRQHSDSSAVPTDLDQKQYSQFDGEDANYPDEISSTNDFSALVEETHHPAKDLYHRQLSMIQDIPSSDNPPKDDTSILESDEVLKQSLISPDMVHTDFVVIHRPKPDIFRRWGQSGNTNQDDSSMSKGNQDSSQSAPKLVVHQSADNIYRREESTWSPASAEESSTSTHGDSNSKADDETSDNMSTADAVTHHPAGGIYRRAARVSPIIEVIDGESEFELTHHWGPGPALPPHPSKIEQSFDEITEQETEKRDARAIPPPEYFEEQDWPSTPVQPRKEFSRRQFQGLDSNDWYRGPPHTIPRPRPIPLPAMKVTSRQSGDDEPDLHRSEDTVHRRHVDISKLEKDSNGPMHRRGSATAGSEGIEVHSQQAHDQSGTGNEAHADRPSHHHKSTPTNGDSIHRRQFTANDLVEPMNVVDDSEFHEREDSLEKNPVSIRETEAPMWKRIVRFPSIVHTPLRLVGRRKSTHLMDSKFGSEINRRQPEDQPEEEQYEEEYQDEYENQQQDQQQDQDQNQEQHQEQDSEPEPELDHEQQSPQQADPKTDQAPNDFNPDLPQVLPAVVLKSWDRVFLPILDKPARRSEYPGTQTPPSRIWRHARRTKTAPIMQTDYVAEACEQEGMSREQMYICYRENSLYSSDDIAEVPARQHEIANTANIVNLDRESQDSSVSKRQSETTEQQDDTTEQQSGTTEQQSESPDAEEEEVENVQVDDSTTTVPKDFVTHIGNPKWVTASPAEGLLQASSVYRRHDGLLKPGVPASKRHHNEEHTSPSRHSNDAGPYPHQAWESKPVDSVYLRQDVSRDLNLHDSAGKLDRRSGAPKDDSTPVGGPEPQVPTLHRTSPAVVVKWSKTPVHPLKRDETTTPALPPRDGPPVQRRQIKNTSGTVATFLAPKPAVYLQLATGEDESSDHNSVLSGKDSIISDTDAVERRETHTTESVATALIFNWIVQGKYPGGTRKHDDRRDALSGEDSLSSSAGVVQRREAKSSSSSSSSDRDGDAPAAGDEAIVLVPESSVRKYSGHDHDRKKGDGDSEKDSRSLPPSRIPSNPIHPRGLPIARPSTAPTPAVGNDGDFAVQKYHANAVDHTKVPNSRRAKRSSKEKGKGKDKDSGHYFSHTIPDYPDYLKNEGTVYKRQSSFSTGTELGAAAVQHDTYSAVFKKPGQWEESVERRQAVVDIDVNLGNPVPVATQHEEERIVFKRPGKEGKRWVA